MARRGTHFAAGPETGSRSMQNRARRDGAGRVSRPVALAIAAVSLAVCVAGGALAWLVSSDSLTNVFGVGSVDVIVNEKGPNGDTPFDSGTDTVKKNVTVENKGNVDAYARVQVNCYYVDGNGNQVWDAPDVSFTTSTPSADWLKVGDDQTPGGTYYYAKPLAANQQTSALFESISDGAANKTAAKGWQFVCDISVQSIQANPTSAVEEAWTEVEVGEDGSLTLASTSTTTGEEA